jgi:hypothetical protein
MRFSKKSLIALSAFILSFVFVPASHAQLNSAVSTVTLNAPLAESLTLTGVTAAVTFALPPTGSVNGNLPVGVTTSWVLAKTRTTSVKLYAYFTTGNALTDAAGTNIPVANVSGNVNGTGATPFTGVTPFSGATGITVFTQPLTVAGPFNSSHGPDSIVLTITTTGLALPAGTYTGTLNLQAQAI